MIYEDAEDCRYCNGNKEVVKDGKIVLCHTCGGPDPEPLPPKEVNITKINQVRRLLSDANAILTTMKHELDSNH